MIINKQFPCNSDELNNVLSFVEGTLLDSEINSKIIYQAQVICEELFVNTMKYGQVKNTDFYYVNLEITQQTLCITLIDNGIPFNPFEYKDPDIKASIEERPIGGLGIYMVKQMSDQYSYRRISNQNQIIITKKLNEK